METANPTTSTIIKGRDLPGAVKVVPEGLSEMIAKREFSEFKMKESFCTSSSTNMESSILNTAMTSSSSFESSSFHSKSSSNAKKVTHVSTEEDRARFSADMTSKCSGTYKPFSQETFEELKHQSHGSEICQENLKSTIQSAIHDLESDLNFNNESSSNNEDGTVEAAGLPELAPLSPPLQKPKREGVEETLPPSEQEQNSILLNSISNSLHLEASSSHHQVLKRRNPRLMYTDSSFYNPKHHPSIAEQVEMAHRLSSALYNDHEGTGQEMFLKRAQKSTNWIYSEDKENEEDFNMNNNIHQKHVTPNLKLVMNPDGKILDYNDLMQGEEEDSILPPSNPLTPEIASSVVKNLEGCKLFAKRRKKASNWIVDGDNVGKSEDYTVIQQENCGQTAAEKISVRERFEDEMKQKQDQSLEMRKVAAMEEMMYKGFEDSNTDNMPTTTNLRSSMPSSSFAEAHGLDWSIHNSQGIDVWMSNIPKSWASFNQKRPSNYKTHLVQDIAKRRTSEESKRQDANFKEEKMVSSSRGSNTMQSGYERSTGVQENHVQQKESYIPEQSRIVPQEGEEKKKPQEEEKIKTEVNASIMNKREMNYKEQHMTSQASIEAVQELSPPSVVKTTSIVDPDLERVKREEYELWFKNQERQQELLEYDCLVKYMEKKDEESLMMMQPKECYQTNHQNMTTFQQSSNVQHEMHQMSTQKQVVQQHQAGHQLNTSYNFEPREEVKRQEASSEQVVQQQHHQAGHQLNTSYNFEPQEEVKRQEASSEQVIQQQHQAGHQLNTSYNFEPREEVKRQEISSEQSFLTSQNLAQESKIKALDQEQMLGKWNQAPQQEAPLQFESSVPPKQQEKVEEEEKIVIPLAPPEPAKPLINVNAIKKPSPSRSSFGREVSKRSSVETSGRSSEEGNVGDSIDYEKRSVRNLVDRFSKTRPGQLPPQYLPQQYSQSCGFEPPLNYLKIKDSDLKNKIPKVKKTPAKSIENGDENEKKAALLEAAERARKEAEKNRASVSEFLLMGGGENGESHHEMKSKVISEENANEETKENESKDILDPSKLLDVENLYPGAMFHNKLSQDENPLSSEISKWDNHNTIARGWVSTPNYANYVPVTFRKKYHVETQKPLEINSQ